MDPFTAIGLASAIVQFVDYASKLVKGTIEIYGSATGDTAETGSLKLVTQKLRDLTQKGTIPSESH